MFDLQVFLPFLVVSDIGFRDEGENLREVAGFLDPKNEVDPIRPTEEGIAVIVESRESRRRGAIFCALDFIEQKPLGDPGFSRHAAGDPDENFPVLTGRRTLYFADKPENLVFALLPHAAGVGDHDVRSSRVEHLPASGLQQDPMDLFGIRVVHRTAERFKIERVLMCHKNADSKKKTRFVNLKSRSDCLYSPHVKNAFHPDHRGGDPVL